MCRAVRPRPPIGVRIAGSGRDRRAGHRDPAPARLKATCAHPRASTPALHRRRWKFVSRTSAPPAGAFGVDVDLVETGVEPSDVNAIVLAVGRPGGIEFVRRGGGQLFRAPPPPPAVALVGAVIEIDVRISAARLRVNAIRSSSGRPGRDRRRWLEPLFERLRPAPLVCRDDPDVGALLVRRAASRRATRPATFRCRAPQSAESPIVSI